MAMLQSVLILDLVLTILIGTLHPFNAALAQPMVVKDPNLKVFRFF